MAQAALVGEPVDVTVERQRVRVVLIPLVAVAVVVLAATLPLLARFLGEGRHAPVLVVLLGSAVVTSLFEVRPIHGLGVMTFESVVVISAAVLYGVAVAAIVAAAAELARNVVRRNQTIRLAYNVASAVVSGARRVR